jgi:hypothetical protein
MAQLEDDELACELCIIGSGIAGLNANREAFVAGLCSHTLYNMGVVRSRVPKVVRDEFGSDTQRCFPLPRRIFDGLRFVR